MDAETFHKRFGTDDQCRAHLAQARWGEVMRCPYCDRTAVSPHNEGDKVRRITPRFQCHSCERSFTVLIGTVFEATKMPLRKWYRLLYEMTIGSKGLSSVEASKVLGVRQKTAWSMMDRIRGWLDQGDTVLLGLLEADETWLGGKPRESNDRTKGKGKDKDGGGDDGTGKAPAKRGRGTDRPVVLGAVERGGRVVLAPVDPGASLDHGTLRGFLRSCADLVSSVLHTDEYAGYNGMNKDTVHRRVNHSKEFATDDLFSGQYGRIHTNTIESVWAFLKRTIYGIHHHVSVRHLAGYLNMAAFSYNHRGRSDRLESAIARLVKPKCA